MTISHTAGPVHQSRPRFHTRRRVESMPLHVPSESYRFVAPRRGRAVIAAMLLAGLVLTAMSAVAAASHPSRESLLATGLSAIAVVGLWAAMQARLPQTVTLKTR